MPNCNSGGMVEHSPVVLPTVSRWLSFAFVRVFIEVLVWAAIFAFSERKPLPFAGGVKRFEFALSGMARRRTLLLVGIFLVVFLGRLAALPLSPVPPPKIQDEFSQLLSADTLASGRLTNPTHPMSFYFETFYVNQNPTYHSMYPPATGLFMAVAQVLTGQPWLGMLFAFAAASAGVCWMLQGWMAPRWGPWGALLFALLAARTQLSENYLGEGIFVLGGVLVLGAIPRIIKKLSIRASVWLGIGAALLATTRPFEGAVFVTGVGLGGIYWAFQKGIPASTLLKRVALPAALVLVPVFALVGYQNLRTTGHVLLAPYQLNLVQQHITRPFVWQKPVAAPVYDHAAMASFYNQWEETWWKKTREFPRGTFLFFADKICMTYAMILWPLGLLVALGAFYLLKNKNRRFLPLAFAFFAAGIALETYQLQPRYTEPAWGLTILMAIYGIRYIGVWRRSTRQGQRISKAAFVLVPAAVFVFGLLVYLNEWTSHTEYWYSARQQLSAALESVPGKQLILVRYSPQHFPQEEWVYNRADIDRAKVVWARDEDDRGRAELLHYFADRTVWLLEPDSDSPTLTSIPANNTNPAVSQVGPFRVFCGDRPCEDLKRNLEVALDGDSKISIAETTR